MQFGPLLRKAEFIIKYLVLEVVGFKEDSDFFPFNFMMVALGSIALLVGWVNG